MLNGAPALLYPFSLFFHEGNNGAMFSPPRLEHRVSFLPIGVYSFSHWVGVFVLHYLSLLLQGIVVLSFFPVVFFRQSVVVFLKDPVPKA